MNSSNTEANLTAWTEVEYSARCQSPYITTPIYLPKETTYYLCRPDGTRQQSRLTFVVFRAVGAGEDEWEDDPMVGNLEVCVLGDGDEEVKPVEAVYLGDAPEDFVTVVREDDNEIVFDLYWSYGDVSVEQAQETDEGWLVKKDLIGEDGILCRLTPHKGEPFTIRLCIPYIGFSLKDATDNNVQGDIEVNHKDAASYAYMFVGNDTNDRFQLSLDGGRLSYMCVANDEGTLSVRNIHDNLSLVTELPLQGTLDELLMGAHSALIKNKSARWRVELVGDEVEGADSLELNGVSLARFAFGLFTAEENVDEDSIAQRLMHMEQRLGFQWFWVDEADWSHENMEGLMDMEGLDADPEKMMRQALLFNRYETFMRRLCAFSYATHNNIQGDQLQARNNKRKIARCVRRVLAHRAGEESLWSLDEEARRENLHFFSTFHREFTQALEE
mgnify:FL=1